MSCAWPGYGTGWTGTYPAGGHWASRVLTPGDDDDVLTVDELNAIARIVAGDEESEALLATYIAAARAQVERDIDHAVITQEIVATYDAATSGVLELPWPPCQDVTAITYTDRDGTVVDVDPVDAIRSLDIVSMPARLTWAPGVFPTTPLGVTLTLNVGWTKDTLPPPLKFAVGLLASHYLTAGRDRTVIGTSVVDMPAGYEEAIAPFRLVRVI